MSRKRRIDQNQKRNKHAELRIFIFKKKLVGNSGESEKHFLAKMGIIIRVIVARDSSLYSK
jgi:hypothetical protein